MTPQCDKRDFPSKMRTCCIYNLHLCKPFSQYRYQTSQYIHMTPLTPLPDSCDFNRELISPVDLASHFSAGPRFCLGSHDRTTTRFRFRSARSGAVDVLRLLSQQPTYIRTVFDPQPLRCGNSPVRPWRRSGIRHCGCVWRGFWQAMGSCCLPPWGVHRGCLTRLIGIMFLLPFPGVSTGGA